MVDRRQKKADRRQKKAEKRHNKAMKTIVKRLTEAFQELHEVRLAERGLEGQEPTAPDAMEVVITTDGTPANPSDPQSTAGYQPQSFRVRMERTGPQYNPVRTRRGQSPPGTATGAGRQGNRTSRAASNSLTSAANSKESNERPHHRVFQKWLYHQLMGERRGAAVRFCPAGNRHFGESTLRGAWVRVENRGDDTSVTVPLDDALLEQLADCNVRIWIHEEDMDLVPDHPLSRLFRANEECYVATHTVPVPRHGGSHTDPQEPSQHPQAQEEDQNDTHGGSRGDTDSAPQTFAQYFETHYDDLLRQVREHGPIRDMPSDSSDEEFWDYVFDFDHDVQADDEHNEAAYSGSYREPWYLNQSSRAYETHCQIAHGGAHGECQAMRMGNVAHGLALQPRDVQGHTERYIAHYPVEDAGLRHPLPRSEPCSCADGCAHRPRDEAYRSDETRADTQGTGRLNSAFQGAQAPELEPGDHREAHRRQPLSPQPRTSSWLNPHWHRP